MLLSVPFYLNDADGNRCMQVTMRCALKYFLDRDVSLDELDKLTGRAPGLWTSTCQAVTVLHDLGLKVTYYSKSDMAPFLQGEPYIRDFYGKDAEVILKHMDLAVFLKSVENLMKYNIFELQKLPFEEIEGHLSKGHLPLINIDSNILYGIPAPFQGHYLAITGFDDEHIFYHESGPKNPEANRGALKSVFIDAWNANGTDNDIIIVQGSR
jgi:hypothetical protein